MRKFVILVLIIILFTGPFAFVSANGAGDDSGKLTPRQDGNATTPTTSATGTMGTGTPHQNGNETTPTTSVTGTMGTGTPYQTGTATTQTTSVPGTTGTVTPHQTGTATTQTTSVPGTTMTVTATPTKDDQGRGESEDDSRGKEGTNHQVNVEETAEGNHTDVTVLKVKIKEKVNETEIEIHSAGVEDEHVVRNQTSLLIGVKALALVNELVAVYGPDITEIKVGLEDSLNATTKAEVRIKDRSPVVRFFTGGDDVAAREIERELDQNQDHIQEMQQLIDQCNCSQEVKDVLQDQIREMEQEQDRLRDLAEQELQDKGLVGWIWK